MKFFRLLVAIQGSYILVTALWPIIHIQSFMEVTGYKTDVWLVKTVGALLIPIALCMLLNLLIDIDKRPTFVLGAGSAVAFICIDFYYALTDVIADIYMADGFLQIIFLIGWIVLAFRRQRGAFIKR